MQITPWYLDLWSPLEADGNSSTSIDLPPYIERIMAIHMRVEDSTMALRDQLEKVKSRATDYEMGMLERVYEFQLALTTFSPPFQNFSILLSMERDQMNHRFRSFVDSYAPVMSRAQYDDLNPLWLVVCPWAWVLSAINGHVKSRWLPAPKVYRFQVQREIRYQADRFFAASIAALDKTDTSFSSIQRTYKLSLASSGFEQATNAIETFQRQLNETIALAKPTSWPEFVWSFSGPWAQNTQQLHEQYQCTERMRESTCTLVQILDEYPIDALRLRDALKDLRFSFDSASTVGIIAGTRGMITLPAILQAQVDHARFSWLGLDGVHGPDDVDDNVDQPSVYHYDLGRMVNVDASTLRAGIMQLCLEHTNRHMVDGGLIMICNIWQFARMLSALDGSVLEGVQRSWVHARADAVRRSQIEAHADYRYIATLASSVYADYQRGTPVPGYVT
ncbi:MAG: hypothetical protein Q9170_008335 [Blastenia crenularia]